MQTGWLIYSKSDAKENKSFINWCTAEASLQDINLKLVLHENIEIGVVSNQLSCQINGQSTDLPELAIVRTIDFLLSLQLEAMGVNIFNPSEVSMVCNNKALTHFMIRILNVPMLDTLFVKAENLTNQPPMSYPFVVKDAESHGGKDVYLIKNQVEWTKHLTLLSSKKLIVQSCDVQLGKDLRVFVVGKKIIGSVLRKSKTDFRANFKLGGSAVWYDLSSHEELMINKIISHFDFGMVGIDFLIDHNGNLLFNEIEDVVGSRILSEVSNKNIVREYMTYIKNRLY